MTVTQLVKAALRASGVTAAGETPNSNIISDGMEDLNMLLQSWAAEDLMHYTTAEVTLTTTTDQAYVDLSAGASPAGRWKRAIGDGFCRISNTDYLVKNISEKEYQAFGNKTTGGRPRFLWYDPQYATGYAYLYPRPDAVYTILQQAELAFTAYTSVSDTVSHPPEWQRAIKWNLALELGPGDGFEPSPTMKENARDSKDIIESLNLNNRMNPSIPVMPGMRASFDINAG